MPAQLRFPQPGTPESDLTPVNDWDPSAQGQAPTPRVTVGLARPALLGLAGTTAIAAGAMLGGKTFETHLPGAWFFGMQGGWLGSFGSESAQPTIASLILVFGGLILLVRVWLQLLRHLKSNPGVPVRKIVLVAMVWAIPLIVAPPLFSRDVYSYAGQGEMVSHHIDPYEYGPGVLGTTPFSTLGDEIWSNTPSPYGPVFLTADGLLDQASGHHILVDLALLRLLELGGLALAVAATPTLARSFGRDPAHAVLLGVGSPLALTALLAGAHNDALMIGLLMAGLAVARRFGTVPGIVLCALAAGVKSPAALGVVFLGWLWAGEGASNWRRIAHTAAAGLIAAAVLELAGLVSGFGWGWVSDATAADASFTGVTPVDAVSRLVWLLARVVHLEPGLMGIRTVFAAIGLLCAAAIGVTLLRRSPGDGLQRSLGLSLLALALLGPILWAWYATWGIVVLAPLAWGRLRTAIIALIAWETFVSMATLHKIATSIFHGGPVPDLLLVTLLLAVAVVPIGRMRTRGSAAHPSPSPSPRPEVGLPLALTAS